MNDCCPALRRVPPFEDGGGGPGANPSHQGGHEVHQGYCCYEPVPALAGRGSTCAASVHQGYCCYEPAPALAGRGSTGVLQGYRYEYEPAQALAGRGSTTSAPHGDCYGSTDAGDGRGCHPPDLERARRAVLGHARPPGEASSLVLHTRNY